MDGQHTHQFPCCLPAETHLWPFPRKLASKCATLVEFGPGRRQHTCIFCVLSARNTSLSFPPENLHPNVSFWQGLVPLRRSTHMPFSVFWLPAAAHPCLSPKSLHPYDSPWQSWSQFGGQNAVDSHQIHRISKLAFLHALLPTAASQRWWHMPDHEAHLSCGLVFQ